MKSFKLFAQSIRSCDEEVMHEYMVDRHSVKITESNDEYTVYIDEQKLDTFKTIEEANRGIRYGIVALDITEQNYTRS